ncbi:probable protein phosphatase 2C 80 isoform X2 [Henckelia pumila]|uniref:probable protein phosphatase 2C 80 isoform X2 n=1 Tax=Henckelia pumila TaxID=405737 RepID=UPI003C6E3770
MPSGFVSNLNVAFGFGFQRAVKVNQVQHLNFIESCLSRKFSGASLTRVVFKYSSNRCHRIVMAASGSLTASGDLVVDNLASSCANFSSFVKPIGVYFNDRSYRNCRKARASLRNVEAECYRGVHGCVMHDFKQSFQDSKSPFLTGPSNGRAFSSSCYSDGVVPEILAVDSFSAEHLSSLALSAEPAPSHAVLKLLSGVCYLPHPAKEETGGEDAHFICDEEQVIGVADGVGGWADVGVNAGLYARELMSNSVKAIHETPKGSIDPLSVLEKAHAATKAMGSSTACIISLKNQGLHAINLGDSGFLVIRDGCTIFESPVQQHGFNFTYQLDSDSRGDLPSSGQVFEIPVVPGDVVVAGSDGLFDNLYSIEIAAIVGDAVKDGLSPDAAANKLATFARVRAVDKKKQSPFSAAAQEAGYAYYGGKLDDITVVVSYVS